MKHYAIKCVSKGEQILAQKVLFKKEVTWGNSSHRIMVKPEGMYLIVRGKRITFLGLSQYDDEERPALQPIEFSEFIKTVRHTL